MKLEPCSFKVGQPCTGTFSGVASDLIVPSLVTERKESRCIVLDPALSPHLITFVTVGGSVVSPEWKQFSHVGGNCFHTLLAVPQGSGVTLFKSRQICSP